MKFHEDGVPNFNGKSAKILNWSCPVVRGTSWDTRNVVIGVPNATELWFSFFLNGLNCKESWSYV